MTLGSLPRCPRLSGASAAWFLAVVILISACGGGGSTTPSRLRPGAFVRIYSSLPSAGPDAARAAQIANGIALALSQHHHRAGLYQVRYVGLDAGSAAGGSPSAGATAVARNARIAATDPSAVFYIGELSSNANRISIPILNEAGIPQLSPTATAIGLTAPIAGNPHSEPPYYPSGSRTFTRLLPNDAVQALASLSALSTARCSRVALAYDRPGLTLAQLVRADAPRFGITVAATVPVGDVSGRLRLPDVVRSTRADCVQISGSATQALTQLTARVHAAAPLVRVFLGSSGMCVPAWTNPRHGGVPSAMDSLLMCTRPTLPLDSYPGAAPFRRAYAAAFGATAVPDVYALLGYTAMQLGLGAVASLGRRGDERSAVLRWLFDTSHATPIGTFSFDRYGDTSLDVYGLYKVGVNGNPHYATTLHPRGGF